MEEDIKKQMAILSHLTKLNNLLVRVYEDASYKDKKKIEDSMQFVGAMYKSQAHTVASHPLTANILSEKQIETIKKEIEND